MDTTASTGTVAQDPPIETSILRDGPEADQLRDRMERPARAGRVILALLGVVTASAGTAMWVTTKSGVGIALAGFGGVLLLLGVVQHLLYRRDQAHWPDQAHLWSDGLELVLRNGEVRGASWSDPDFSIELIARRAPSPAEREYVMIWLMDPKIPPVELSAKGFERVRQSAATYGLDLSQNRRGSRADSTQMIHIHPTTAATAAARAEATRTPSGPG